MSVLEDRLLQQHRALARRGGPPIPSGATPEDAFPCVEFYRSRTYGECMARHRGRLRKTPPEGAIRAPREEPKFPACAACPQGRRVAKHFGLKPAWPVAHRAPY